MPPLDAVVGGHGPRAPGSCQCYVGFGNSLPIGPPPIADGIAASGCDMGARDNLVRDATGGVQSLTATEKCSGLVQDVVVHEKVKLGPIAQP